MSGILYRIMVNAGSLSKEKYLLGKFKRDKLRPGFELDVAAASESFCIFCV